MKDRSFTGFLAEWRPINRGLRASGGTIRAVLSHPQAGGLSGRYFPTRKRGENPRSAGWPVGMSYGVSLPAHAPPGRTHMTAEPFWDVPLASVVDEAGIGVWRWDPATNAVQWDQRTEQLYGLEPGTFDGTMEAYLGMIHPDDVDDALELIQSVAANGGLYSIRHRVVTPEGAVRWIEGQGRIDVKPDGTPIRGLGIVYDVTDRATLEKERDELLQREEAAVRASVESRDALDFLIRAADALAGSLNTERVVERLAQVPPETGRTPAGRKARRRPVPTASPARPCRTAGR